MVEGNILVIDDEEVICNLIKDALTEKGYSVVFATNAKKGLELAKLNSFDAVFIDLRMPEIDGLAVLMQIKQLNADNVAVMVTGYPSFETVKEAIRWGAFDYITKPFELESLLFTARRAVAFHRLNQENKRLMEQITQENILLEKKVQERTKDLRNLYRRLQTTFVSTVKALAKALDARDHYTHSHSENVAKYAVLIAKEMQLSTKEIDEIKNACELHDLGKIGIHDYILSKPGELTPEEWEEVKLHSLKSAEILQPLDFLDEVIILIREHHERYDGAGYPDGLKGDAIKLGARIMSVADTYDAMTSKRPYREKAFSKEEAVEEIKRKSGSQFDPKVVEAFLRIADKF
ncbi:MAG: response regulator [Candidatus Omnitrophica bacterium]|nr:response regulator [Candidatus Omnitrophota bacterium]MDD5610673.1 response regulator [Candidatus Omnitrophota bacterium]